MKLKKYLLGLGFTLLAIACVFTVQIGTINAAVLTGSTTVENVTVGEDNNVLIIPPVTVVGARDIKASAYIYINSSSTPGTVYMPQNNNTVTIGSCVITFASSTGTTTDELNCSNNNASIDLDLGAGNTPRTDLQLLTAVSLITGVTDTIHGALSVTDTIDPNQTVNFTTAAALEVSTTTINIATTSNNVLVNYGDEASLYRPTTDTLAISGVVEKGDSYSVAFTYIEGETEVTSTSTYVALEGDTTEDVAAGLDSNIKLITNYNTLGFTSSSTGSDLIISSKTVPASPGYGVSQVFVTNRSAVAQQVIFTPADVEYGTRFEITINGTMYSYTATAATVANATAGINSALSPSSAVISCTNDSLKVICTSTVEGTSFAYSTSVVDVVRSSGGGSRGGGGSTVIVPPTPTPTDVATLRAELKKQIVGLIQELLKQLIAELSALQGN